MNDDELTDLLDHAIGAGPTGPHLEAVLREGARASRRRRAGIAAAVAAVAVIAGAGAVAATGAGGPGTDTAPVVEPTPTPTDPGPPLATDTVSLDDFLESGDLVELRAGGLVRLRPGVTVVQWVDNPIDRVAPDHSMGLALRYQGKETWHLLDYDDLGDDAAGVSGTSSPAGEGADTFDAWLTDQVETAQQPVPEYDDPLRDQDRDPLVELQPDGSLRLADGVEVLAQVENPVHLARPNRSVAVRFTYEGRERWTALQILVDDGGRVTGGGADPVYADDLPQMTFDEFAAQHFEKVFHP